MRGRSESTPKKKARKRGLMESRMNTSRRGRETMDRKKETMESLVASGEARKWRSVRK